MKKTKNYQIKYLICILYSFVYLNVTAQVSSNNQKINKNIQKSILAKKTNKSIRSSGLESIENETSFNKGKSSLYKDWIVKNNNVLIIAKCNGNVEELKKELQALDVKEIKAYGMAVTGYIPMGNIPKLENCKHLRSVVPDHRPIVHSGKVTSGGVRAMYTQDALKRYGVDGTGVKIGIISNSYDIIKTFDPTNTADQGVKDGELPGPDNPFGYTKPVQVLSEFNIDNLFIFAFDEGRAMAEIVHDVAPGAEIYFYSAFNGYFDFADGIRALAANGCNIIVDDIGYFVSPFFQDGVVAQAVEEVSKAGVLYFSAAGNGSNNSYESNYKFLSVVNEDQTTTEFFDFGNQNQFQTIILPPGDTATLVFQWDSPSIYAGNSITDQEKSTDIDLFLTDSKTQEIVAFAENDNFKEQDNLEILSYTNSTDSIQELDFSIIRFSGKQPTRIKYINFGIPLTYKDNTAEGINASTIFGHSNAKNSISVGANDFKLTPAFGKDYEIESFSSVGGTRILLDKSGNPIAEEIRQKPDLVAPDGGETSFFGDFFGTSAAAPHLAALVALLKQYDKKLSNEKILKILSESALDMDNPYTEGFDKGFDFATGNGFVVADRLFAMLKDKPSVYRYEVINAGTQKIYGALFENDSIDLADVEEGALLNIRALAIDGNKNVQRVLLSLSGKEITSTVDSAEPFSLFGDTNGTYKSWKAKTGNYKISGFAFPDPKDIRFPDRPYELSFNITTKTKITNAGLRAINNVRIITFIKEGDKIDLKTISESVKNNLNITNIVNGRGQENGEVYSKLVGPGINYEGIDMSIVSNRSEVFSDNLGNPIPWTPIPVVGQYKLQTQFYARRGDPDSAGELFEVNFEFIDSTVAPAARLGSTTNDLTIFPNPSIDGVVTINSISSENLKNIQIYDSNGMQVYGNNKINTVNSKQQKINLSNLHDGLYIVKASGENGYLYSSKLMIKTK